MIPKVKFKYSHVYYQNWQTWFGLYGKSPRSLSPQKVQSYTKNIGKFWEKHQDAVLKEISRITGLKWIDREISCYIVGDCRPFSDPLTLPVHKNKTLFVDVLTHELIHQIFSQGCNYKKADKAWKYFFEKYEQESRLTKIHIPLSAIHQHIYLKFFNRKRLSRDITKSGSVIMPDYKRAWEIVEKDGHENIIKEFSSRIVK